MGRTAGTAAINLCGHSGKGGELLRHLDVSCRVQLLDVRQRRRFNDLLEEALQDLLKKYREKKKVEW